MSLPPEDRPDWRRPEYDALAPKRQRSRDLVAGTDAVQAAGQTYLPKWRGEDGEDYAVRQTLTEVFGAYPRTVTASVGMVFATPPAVGVDESGEQTQLPAPLAEFLDDVDGRGSVMPVFARQLFDDAIIDGLAGILTDYQTVADPGAVSIAETKRQGLRPSWIPVRASQVINWRVEAVGGKPTLTLLVLAEEATVPKGSFGLGTVCRYRVFRREMSGAITWQLYTKTGTGDQATFALEAFGTITGPQRIPFSPCVTGRESAAFVAAPPLDDLAVLSVGHYRVAADRRYLMHICHAPVFTVSGEPQAYDGANNPIRRQWKLGPNSVLEFASPDAKAAWVQADPNALTSSKEEKEEIKREMAALGMAFLSQDRGSARETAEGRRLDGAAEHATLATAARALQDCLENALADACAFLGVADVPGVRVTTSYDEGTLDAPTILALNALAKDGNITQRRLLEVLKTGRILPSDVNVDDELAELEADAAAKQQQAIDMANATAESRAQQLANQPPKAA
jgi:hypothetical protein